MVYGRRQPAVELIEMVYGCGGPVFNRPDDDCMKAAARKKGTGACRLRHGECANVSLRGALCAGEAFSVLLFCGAVVRLRRD